MEKLPVLLIFPAHDPPDSLIGIADHFAKLPGYAAVVVDDASGPEYDAVFARLGDSAALVRLSGRPGRGAAVKAALKWAAGSGTSFCGAVVAGRGEHGVQDIAAAAEKTRQLSGPGIVLGCRDCGGNAVTAKLFALRTGVRLSDAQADLRGFPSSMFGQLAEVPGRRDEYDMNVLLMAAEEGIPILEIPAGHGGSGRLRPLRDSLLICSHLLKFAMVSFTAFLIDYAIVMLLNHLTSGWAERLSLVFSVVCARIVSSTYCFTLNRLAVFKSRNSVAAAASQFYLLAASILAMNYLLLDLLTITARVPLWLAKPLTDLLLFIVNYLVQSRVIFKKKKGKREQDHEKL